MTDPVQEVKQAVAAVDAQAVTAAKAERVTVRQELQARPVTDILVSLAIGVIAGIVLGVYVL